MGSRRSDAPSSVRAAPGYAHRMAYADVIDVRPGVRSGKPCFVGTRIAVYDVLEYLASGMTHGEILASFPELTGDFAGARRSL
jgi:uncharacterized protein (DUF433 family)